MPRITRNKAQALSLIRQDLERDAEDHFLPSSDEDDDSFEFDENDIDPSDHIIIPSSSSDDEEEEEEEDSEGAESSSYEDSEDEESPEDEDQGHRSLHKNISMAATPSKMKKDNGNSILQAQGVHFVDLFDEVQTEKQRQAEKQQAKTEGFEKVKLHGQYIKFGQRLAHSSEKSVRDRGIKILKQWLSAQKQLSFMDFLKLWKGLFYAMWLSDKPLVQHELARNLAGLIFEIDKKLRMDYFESFLITMEREWIGLDKHRLDKYLALIRYCFAALITYLHSENWNAQLITEFNHILFEQATSPFSEQIKIKDVGHHLIELYVEELHKVVGDKLPKEVLPKLLEPFLHKLAFSEDRLVKTKIQKLIFEPLIQAELERMDLQVNPDADYHEYATNAATALVVDQNLPIENTFLPFDLQITISRMEQLIKKTKMTSHLNHLIKLCKDAISWGRKLKKYRKRKEKRVAAQSSSFKKFKAERDEEDEDDEDDKINSLDDNDFENPEGESSDEDEEADSYSYSDIVDDDDEDDEEDDEDRDDEYDTRHKKSASQKIPIPKRSAPPPPPRASPVSPRSEPPVLLPAPSRLKQIAKSLSKISKSPSKTQNRPASPSKNNSKNSSGHDSLPHEALPARNLHQFSSPPARQIHSYSAILANHPHTEPGPSRKVTFNLRNNTELLFQKTALPNTPLSAQKSPSKGILRVKTQNETVPHLKWQDFFY